MNGNLDNCPSCGEIFVKALRSVCNKCHKEVEEKYQSVYTFIRKKENRMATVPEVTFGTGVKEELIYRFIREGRIKVNNFPNLAYPCDSCGTMISEGRICNRCKTNIARDISLEQTEKEIQERNKQVENLRKQTYETLNDRF
ncbi:TIGR03826 family flagellar region protein [Bacillus alkalicellulosilyticus]|uniref:TIGR03826 family flagellar region protein n=1 Tax=Alkalihalobacterium alkalicellulosilyticum TaxID=1912214 RepID=UPI00099682E5|nr:TIGR03826 family flagellar region protein [Bacillus alkalicellulosilyticus]